MALTHTTVCRTAMADAVRVLIDALCSESGNRIARIVLKTSGGAELATIFIDSDDPFGSGASSGVITMDNSPVPEDSNATGGGAALTFHIQSPPASPTPGDNKANAGIEVLQGSVDTQNADLNMSSTTINSGDAVRINSLTWTAPQ